MESGQGEGGRWRSWVTVFAAAAPVFAGLLLIFVIAMDPYGMRASARANPRALMDINQRFMYPQVVRSGRFDAAIFGTSTLRLIDPETLGRAAGMHFANLAMNAATPWEQVQMAGLFAREVANPKALIWGLETTWCEADATQPEKRLTPRPFPPWLYGKGHWFDWFRLLDFNSLEIAVRMASYRLGLGKERIRRDGFEIFTPPEASYDAAQARLHLYGSRDGRMPDLSPLDPPPALSAAERAGLSFPALAWLETQLRAFPPATRRILVLPPVHAASQPRSGSHEDQIAQRCKAAIAAIADRQGASLVDYRRVSGLTRDDANFWDPLHYRLPVAARIERVLSALAGASPVPPADPDAEIRAAPR